MVEREKERFIRNNFFKNCKNHEECKVMNWLILRDCIKSDNQNNLSFIFKHADVLFFQSRMTLIFWGYENITRVCFLMGSNNDTALRVKCFLSLFFKNLSMEMVKTNDWYIKMLLNAFFFSMFATTKTY